MTESIWVVVSDEVDAEENVEASACRAFTGFKDAQAYKRKLKEMFKEDGLDINFTIQNCILVREV
jgi:hypothetical protein